MIYFILNIKELAVKIGYTNNLTSRLSDLQVANCNILQVLLVIDGDLAKEKQLHNRFKHIYIRGEWFRYTEELASFINKYHCLKLNASSSIDESKEIYRILHEITGKLKTLGFKLSISEIKNLFELETGKVLSDLVISNFLKQNNYIKHRTNKGNLWILKD